MVEDQSVYSLVLFSILLQCISALKQAVADQEISSLDRIQLLLDMKRLCNAQRVKPSDLLSFMEAYKQEMIGLCLNLKYHY